jgi:hypothetical protein
MVAAVALALAASACFKDPTSDLRGSPSRLKVSRVYIVQSVGDTDLVSIEALDEQGNPQSIAAPTFSTGDAAVAEAVAVPDTIGGTLPGAVRWAAKIAANGAGRTTINVTAAGQADSIVVLVFPTSFTGAVTASVAEGSVVTIAATASVGFVPAATTVTLDGNNVRLDAVTASQITFKAWGVNPSQAVVVKNLLLLGQFALDSLVATTAVTVTNPAEPGDGTPAGATAITLPAAVGDSAMVSIASVSSADVDDFYTFTTTTADSLEIVVQWTDGTSDVDAYLLNAAGTNFCVLDGCSAATGADPERIRVRLAAATTYRIDINWFAKGTFFQTPYTIKVFKRG